MRHGRLASGLGAMGLVVLTVVVAGCGPETTPTDRDGGALAAPTTTTDDAPPTPRREPASAAPSSAPSPDPSPASTPAPVAPASPEPSVAPPVEGPPVEAPRREALPERLPVPLPPALDPEVVVPDSVSINTARVVVNQSNVAVNTGGVSGSSSSPRSVVESDAAILVVERTSAGLEVVSLDVRPGWIEAVRSQTAERLTLRYVLGASAVDISVWAAGSGVASSVSASFDR